MPKLSAITTGSTIKLPLLAGGTVDAKYLAYNHYGRQEALVVVPEWCSYCARVDEATWYRAGGGMNELLYYTYEFSGADRMADHVAGLLSKGIQSCLTPVPIPLSGSSKTIYRSVFLPSLTEAGVSGGPTTGSRISELASLRSDYRFTTRDVLDTSAAYYITYVIGGKPSNTSGSGHTCEINSGYLISLDGNVEVATSSGGQSPSLQPSSLIAKSTESGTEQSERLPERGCT